MLTFALGIVTGFLIVAAFVAAVGVRERGRIRAYINERSDNEFADARARGFAHTNRDAFARARGDAGALPGSFRLGDPLPGVGSDYLDRYRAAARDAGRSAARPAGGHRGHPGPVADGGAVRATPSALTSGSVPSPATARNDGQPVTRWDLPS